MNRFFLFLLLLLLLLVLGSGFLGASPFMDEKIEIFVEALQAGRYEAGIDELLSGSALEEKVVNVSQTMTNWVNQFIQIRDLYGDYLGFEKVATTKLGRLEESVYLVYCEFYPIQIIMTEYDNGEANSIINMVFNDSVLETLALYGISNE